MNNNNKKILFNVYMYITKKIKKTKKEKRKSEKTF